LYTSIVREAIELQLLAGRESCAVGHVGRRAADGTVALMASREVVLYDNGILKVGSGLVPATTLLGNTVCLCTLVVLINVFLDSHC